MSSSRILAAALGLWACGRSAAPGAPAPASIAPSAVHTSAEVPVVIKGSGFLLTATRRLGHGQFEVDSTFHAWLGATPLREVAWVDEQTLRAVVPVGLAGDALDLTVEGPTGRGMLAGAFRASPLTPPSLAMALAAPAEVEAGQPFLLQAQVSNAGQQEFGDLALRWPGMPGLSIGPVATAAPQAATFQVPAQAALIGDLSLSASATAVDTFTGDQLTVTSPPVAIRVLAGPRLRAVPRAPAAVNVGQPFEVAVDVVNDGDADALGVQLATPAAASGAAVADGPAAAAQDIAAGAMRTFAWSFLGQAVGPLELSATGAAVDALTSLPLPLQVAWDPVAVQSPAALSALASAPPTVSVGQRFGLQLDVTNGGDAAAAGVVPALSPGSNLSIAAAPSAQDIPGHATRPFVWQLDAIGPGPAALALAANGTDVNSGASVSGSPQPQPVVAVQVPASLTAAAAAPAQVSAQQTFDVDVQVVNSGEAAALAVAPGAPGCSGAGALQLVSQPPARDVPGMGSATLTWTWRALSSGAVDCQMPVAGTDANSGSVVPAVAAGHLVVQAPAVLSIESFTAPPRLSRGQSFPVSLVVRNTGEAIATGVSPGTPAVAAGGLAAAVTTTSQAPVALAGGASATFQWTFTETGSGHGTLAFSAAVSGTDSNSGAAVASAPAQTAAATVQEPATLRIDALTAPAAVDSGQAFTATLLVRNTGEATANLVAPAPATPTVAASGGAAATTSSAPSSFPLAGGGTAAIAWMFTESGSGSGSLTLSVGVTGTDGNSGAGISSLAPASAVVAVQAPAALSAQLLAPGLASVGQQIAVSLRVSNSGESGAVGVLPRQPVLGGTGGLTLASAPAAQDVPGMGSATFTWTYVASAAGGVTISAAAEGRDANSGAAVTAAAMAQVQVQRAAALRIDSFSAPARVDRGQGFTVTMTVTNSGEAAATAVAPSTPVLSATGGASAATASAPAPVFIAGGASATFTWAYAESGSATGGLSFAATVSGRDANDGVGGAISAGPATAGPMVVESPAQLSVLSLTAPAAVSRGQSFTITLEVANGGDAVARAVVPEPPSPAVAVTGAAAASTATVQQPVDIPGGGVATFSWTFTEDGTGSGSLQFSCGASGSDANSGASLSAAAQTSQVTAVQQPARLVVSALVIPGAVSRGQAFSAAVQVVNVGEATALQTLPSPSPPSVSATGGAAAVTSSSPPAVDIPGGGSATFTFAYAESGTAPGTLTFSAAAQGIDENSGGPVGAGAVRSSPCPVQSPAALAVTSFVVPAVISGGQAFTVSATVANTGQATALSVDTGPSVIGSGAAVALTSPAAVPADLAGGQSVTFTWSYQETSGASGSLSFSLAAAGRDGNSGAAVASSAAAASTQVQAAAALSVTSISAPPFITRGQTFNLLLTVANAGEAAALLVAPSQPAIASGGGAQASTSSSPGAVSIPGGSSVSFSWTYVENGSSAGTLRFTAGAGGFDANSSAAVNASPVSTATITVQEPAQLAITSFSLPGSVTRGQSFTVGITVQNTGGTAVDGVLPSPAPPSLSVTGGGHATVQLPAPAAVAQLGPGASVTFPYTFTEDGTGPGSLSFAGAVCGTDAVNGLQTCANQTSTGAALVQSPPALAITSFQVPASLSRGQTFTASLDVKNGGQASAVNVLPDPPVIGGLAHASILSAPPSATISGGGTARFSWSLVEDGSATGSLALTSRVTGADANSLAAISSPPASSNTAVVQQPAALVVTSLSAPALVSRGQSFTVSMVVTNTGEATALQVRPTAPAVAASGGASAASASLQSPATLGGGASATFTWTFAEAGTGSGALSFSCAATGTDANSAAALDAAPASASTTVQGPAVLAVTSFTVRSALGLTSIDRGQDFVATLTVSNSGEAAATGVLPNPGVPAVSATGGAAASGASAPVAATVAGGTSAAFTWTFHESGTGPGDLQLSAGVSGNDANSGAALSAAPASSNALSVQSAPALSVVSVDAPAKLSRGQGFTVAVTVRNAGGATATGVVPDAPALAVTGGAHASTSTAPAAVPLAAGASATFSWTYLEDGNATGTLAFTTRATGIDANTGAALATAQLTSPVTAVQRPAALSIASLAVPATISRGQGFQVTLVVANTGEALAQNVAPSPDPPAPAAAGGASASVPAALPAVGIAGGSTATFTFDLVENGTGTGSLSFSAGASGSDANSSAPVAAAAASASTTVQRPAALSVTAFTLRSALGNPTINRGQAFTASLTVANTGEASATGVLPSAPAVTATGGAAATTSSSPSAADIAGGASATFRWSFVENGTAPGTLLLTAGAGGADGNSGAAVSTGSAQSEVASVQAPAALSASLSAPSLVLLLQTFTISLTITNGGGGTVNALAPSSLSITGASTTVLGGPTPASATLAGGGNVTFSWTCRANAIGSIAVTASASGTDANDGSTRFASASTSTTVAEVSQISSDPFGDGSTFAYVFDFNGRVYLGPNKNNTGGVRMLPDGSSVENVTFNFNNDTAQKDLNTYNGAASPYPSLGYAGCTKNTAQCGPDNEDGRGVYGSGLIAGTPWLIASGALSGGGLGHLYATTDTMTAPDFDYIGVKTILGGEVQGSSAMIVFHDRIYLGFPSAKANRPFLAVVNTLPPTPGYDATSAEVVNLASTKMPNIGAGGSPKNSAAIQMIDAFAAFNDRLYLGNNGGWMRSTTNTPGPYSTAPADWAVATPSAAAYAAKTSVTSSKLADLLPSDRALPQMAVLNGKLYAARNTTAGPQLWACTPGADLACDPADWSLIAANTSGDTLLSQFNDPDNAAITLLAASPSYLYLGFDDAIDGVRVYRSSNASPSSMADFQGRAGCAASAGSASCPGLGGDGFGAGMTRIFDGRVLGYGGADYLYLTAGAGTGAVRVFRIAE